jgi:hypothetical protein
MASSITAAGVVFPDATVQTTAAGAGSSSLDAIATGSLSNGSTVVVNADGTVSVVAGAAQAVGTAVVFDNQAASYISAAYDSTNNKVVVAYSDGGNSSYGTAIVGTVSGASISFGTAVVFESAFTLAISATYDVSNNKIVIAYRDNGNSDYGTLIVGTVSGTSISFGTAVVFNNAITFAISAAYDSTNNKVVIAYPNGGNSFYGTARVGTVSGTSASFGTAVVFESASIDFTSIAYDPTNNKIVIAYRDDGNSRYGTAVIGTISGTAISFGTASVFENAETELITTTHDSENNKIVIAYRDVGNSNYGTAVVGTISGTSISFGTASVFRSANVGSLSSSYDSTSKKVIISYSDNGNSGYGTLIAGAVSGTSISFASAIVFQNTITSYIFSIYNVTDNKIVISYSANSLNGASVVFQPEFTNLTAENYIGISDAAYTNGQTATIQLVGAVDDAQTGLTAGQKYYVTKSGTLSLTPDTPSVLAGTAVSATKLVIKR